MNSLHSIPSGEEGVLVLHGSQHLHENSEDLREFLDYFFSCDYGYIINFFANPHCTIFFVLHLGIVVQKVVKIPNI